MKTEAELAIEAKAQLGETASAEELEKAMDTLREAETALGAGKPAVPTEVDDLEKAVLEGEAAMGDLFKSDGGSGDELGAGAGGDDLGDFGKSEYEELELGESELHDEMVKASEAFVDLTKSVEAGTAGTSAKLDALLGGMKLLSTVVFKQAAVVGTLTKSVQDGAAAAGKQPIGASKTQLGVNALDQSEKMVKSRTEIQADLKKAVDAGDIKPYFLSAFASKGVEGLPADIRKIIGLEVPVA